jgi:hypothetical protein
MMSDKIETRFDAEVKFTRELTFATDGINAENRTCD